jgi:hypothetical protein
MYSVSYEIVTPESAEDGDSAESGWIVEHVGLREAFEAVHGTRTNEVDGISAIEADSCPLSHGAVLRWVTVTNGMEYRTGAVESRSIHFPKSITRASAIRLARLLGVTHN